MLKSKLTVDIVRLYDLAKHLYLLSNVVLVELHLKLLILIKGVANVTKKHITNASVKLTIIFQICLTVELWFPILFRRKL